MPGLGTWQICHLFRNLQSKCQTLTERLHLLSCRTLDMKIVSETGWCRCYQKLCGERSLTANDLSTFFGFMTNLLYQEHSFSFCIAFTDLIKAKCISLVCGTVQGLFHTVSDAPEIAVDYGARINFGRTLIHFFVKLMCISHFQCFRQKIIW